MHHYDVCIVGAGIAGLYAGYEWKKRNTGKMIVLEAGPRAGGRLETARFGGADVPLGAGIGRLEKDRLLIALLQELGIEKHVFARHVNYVGVEHEHMHNQLRALGAGLTDEARDMDFGEYARRTLGRDGARAFIEALGYTDMVRENAWEVVRHYGLDDNVEDGSHGFAVPWLALTKALVKAIGHKRFLYDTRVTHLSASREEDYVTVHTPYGHLTAKHVIVAVTAPVLRQLFPRVREYRSLQSQPFLRLYAKFAKESRDVMAARVTAYTVVKKPLQKVIPMDARKGVYMIAYADNAYARALKNKIDDTPANRTWFARLLERTLGLTRGTLEISSMRGKYWEDGTHYAKAGASYDAAFWERARNPAMRIRVVGEAVAAHNRGWVEGALQTIEE